MTVTDCTPAIVAQAQGAHIPETKSSGMDQRRDAEIVAALDRRFQAAVKVNDAQTMREILHPEFTLVLGDGRVQNLEEILAEAERKDITYEVQDEAPGSQCVRVWGDTAVVTAKLRIKGSHGERTFDRTLWFSDTYVREDQHWRYAFGQASLPLPT